MNTLPLPFATACLRPRHASVFAVAALLALAGCASAPVPDDPRAQAVVTRTSGSTVWATPEAEAAVAAAAEAAAAARRSGATRAGLPVAQAPTAAAAVSPAAAAPAPASRQPVAAAPAAQPAVATPSQRLVFFEFDSFDIHPNFREMLEGHASALKADPATALVVEGHADERGSAEYNLALGQKRAVAVVKTLLLLGAQESQLEAVSFGDTRPVDPARTFEAWAKNRRAEMRLR